MTLIHPSHCAYTGSSIPVFSVYRDHSEVDVFWLQGVGAGALQNGKVLVVLLYGLVDPAHGLHGLHATGHHHRTT